MVWILKCVIDTKLTVNMVKDKLLYFINPSPSDKTPSIPYTVDGSLSDGLKVVFDPKPGNIAFTVHAYVLTWFGIVTSRKALRSISGYRWTRHETNH